MTIETHMDVCDTVYTHHGGCNGEKEGYRGEKE